MADLLGRYSWLDKKHRLWLLLVRVVVVGQRDTRGSLRPLFFVLPDWFLLIPGVLSPL